MIIDFGTPGTAFPTEPIIKSGTTQPFRKNSKKINGNTVGANCVRPLENA